MEDIKNIKYLLRGINIVRKKFEEREKNEDNFNMFTILRKASDEVYLHINYVCLSDTGFQDRCERLIN